MRLRHRRLGRDPVLAQLNGWIDKHGTARLEMTPRAFVLLGRSNDSVELKRAASGSVDADGDGNTKLASKRSSPKSSPSKTPSKSAW